MSIHKAKTEPISKENNITNYELKETLGRGTFGKVKLAIHIPTGEKRAIKILNKKQIEVKKEIHLVKRELKALKILSHPNLVHVNSIFQDNDNYYIDMEYCEKGELFDYIVNAQSLTENEASMFFYQLIEAVEYIHNNKIAHRDLKPENLLLKQNKSIKIIDFGLSNHNDGKNLLSTKCGSPSYASPEILRGYKYDGFKTDIWSCGIILFAMLCGFLPFEGKDNNILFQNIINGKINYPDTLSINAKQIIKQMLKSNPEERISISKIKKTPFYLKGKQLYNIKYNKNEKKFSENNLVQLNFSSKDKDDSYFSNEENMKNSTLRKRLIEVNHIVTDKKENKKNKIKKHHPMFIFDSAFPKIELKLEEKTLLNRLKIGSNEINNKTSENTSVNILDKVKSPNLNNFLKEKGVKLTKKPFIFVNHNYYTAFFKKEGPIILTEPIIIGSKGKKIYHNKNINSIAGTFNLPKL